MSSTMTSDRGMMGMPAMGMMPAMLGMPMNGMMPGASSMNSAMNGMMMPRCMMKMEKCPGGMKCTMTCADKTAAEMMKNLCMMMQGGMVSMCCMMNGMPVCMCNMGMMGMCKMEMMDMGCMMTCTSGDPNCMKMIQACCDCMSAMMMPGCTCCMMMNGMPVCCCVC
jgi:hypothetical protein